ncbi:MAG: PepSY domain-containing protein [Clostridia bacterium]|nr:PepSY domain-containing protein [Clostridia bacterium]
MKKIVLIFTGLLVSSLLVSCASYTDIPSDSVHSTETAPYVSPEASVLQNEPALADFYAYDLSSPAAYDGVMAETETVAHIDRDRAIDAALNHVNLSLTDVFDVEAELERESFGTFWEVEFNHERKEYSFYIDAESGNVVRHYVEYDD